jgi:hypothetical protein
LEKKAPNGRWVEDKKNPHRRMVMEGRMGYWELLVRLNGVEARWEVIGPFEERSPTFRQTASKAGVLEGLTKGQRETLEYVGSAYAEGKGVTAAMVANAKANAEHERDAKPSEIQVSRKQLKALQSDGLLSKTKTGNSDLFFYRGG